MRDKEKRDQISLTPLPTLVIQLGLEPRTLPQSGMLYLLSFPAEMRPVINCFDFLPLMNLSLAIADLLSG